MKKKSRFSFLLFNLITVCCTAQTEGYKFYSKLDTVKMSGFYNIEVTPELSAHLKTDYSDLRIINSSNKWVPHLFHYPNEVIDGVPVIKLNFTKTENTRINTILIIENEQGIISNMELTIRNTAAERTSVLSGSDDNKNWFIINDSIMLNPAPAETGSENTFRINFPPSNYKFFKLLIRNNNKDPFDITGVVQNISSTAMLHAQNRLVHNPTCSISQKDKSKISYIKIIQQQPYHFDHISLKLSGVKFFNRKAGLYISSEDDSTPAKPGNLLEEFTISDKKELSFRVPLSKAKVFYILINNEDNLPLTVNEVETSLLTRYITAYLEKDSSYKLIMDNSSAVTPDYDLPQLSNKSLDSIPFLQFDKITALPESITPAIPQKNNKWLLWSAIAVALLILLFFTYRMFKEVDKKESK